MLLLCISFGEYLISYLMWVFLLFIEKYFDMKKNQCKEGLDIYKKFLTRMTRISEFLKVAEVNFSQPNFALYLKQLIKCLFYHKEDTASFQANCSSIKGHLVSLCPGDLFIWELYWKTWLQNTYWFIFYLRRVYKCAF